MRADLIRMVCCLMVLTLMTVIGGFAQTVDAIALSEAVTAKLTALYPKGVVQGLRRDCVDGATVYYVRLMADEKTHELRFTDKGMLVSEKFTGVTVALPQVCLDSLTKTFKGTEIQGIERHEFKAEPTFTELAKPRVLYRVKITDKKKKPMVWMAEDGTILTLRHSDKKPGKGKDKDKDKDKDKGKDGKNETGSGSGSGLGSGSGKNDATGKDDDDD